MTALDCHGKDWMDFGHFDIDIPQPTILGAVFFASGAGKWYNVKNAGLFSRRNMKNGKQSEMAIGGLYRSVRKIIEEVRNVVSFAVNTE